MTAHLGGRRRMSAGAERILRPGSGGGRGLALIWRLAALIAFGFLGCLVGTTVLSLERAAQSVRHEMDAALAVAVTTMREDLASLADRSGPTGATTRASLQIELLVSAFRGNRHVGVDLRSFGGPLVLPIHDAPNGASLPAWFVNLVGVGPTRVELTAPGKLDGRRVVVMTDPHNEIMEVWNEFSGEFVLLSGVLVPMAVAIVIFMARALRPLRRLARAMERIGEGDYAIRFEERLPRELAPLATTFNAMAERLAEASDINFQLATHLESVQELERGELARDLHDEIGPYLFTAAVDASRIPKDLAAGRVAQVTAAAAAISDAMAQMQRLVRTMLTRLRPSLDAEPGVRIGIEQLVGFWSRRYPEIAIETRMPDAWREPEPLVERTILRVVQESLCNAFRHGRPQKIQITVDSTTGDSAAYVVRIEDDGHGRESAGDLGDVDAGMGLRGMAERVRAVGGRLTIANRPGQGFVVEASVPEHRFGANRLPALGDAA